LRDTEPVPEKKPKPFVRGEKGTLAKMSFFAYILLKRSFSGAEKKRTDRPEEAARHSLRAGERGRRKGNGRRGGKTPFPAPSKREGRSDFGGGITGGKKENEATPPKRNKGHLPIKVKKRNMSSWKEKKRKPTLRT